MVTWAVEEFLWERQISLDMVANLTAPLVKDGLKLLQFPLIRGGEHDGKADIGWVLHHFANSWQ